jgi:hypothetical protein
MDQVPNLPVKPKTLIEIMAEAQTLATDIMEAGGELSPELEKQLLVNETAMAEKIDGYVLIMEALADRASYLKAKANELSNVAKGLESARESLKDRVKWTMLENELTTFAGTHYRFKLSPVNPKYTFDLEALPAKYKKIEVVKTEKADREAIVNAMKAGEAIPGVRVEEVYSLRTYNNR